MHARCVTLFVYHVSCPQVNLHKSDFNTHILYGVVPVCPHRADARLLAGRCPRHLITGRRNLSRLHLER